MAELPWWKAWGKDAKKVDNEPTSEGVIVPPSMGDEVVVPEESKGVVLPTLGEVAKVVTGSAKTGELVGIVRPWRQGDRPWAVEVNGVCYARVDGEPIDSDTMWKAGYRPPFKFKKMTGGGWKPNEEFLQPDGSIGIKSKRRWTKGGWSWDAEKDQYDEAAEDRAERQRKDLGLDKLPLPKKPGDA